MHVLASFFFTPFDNWLTGGGIFTALQTAGVPWADDVTAINLDIEYHSNVAGMRYISPLIDNIKENDTLTSAEITTLANVLMVVYGDKWEKLYNTINYTFDPTAPYNMTETLSNDVEVLAYGKTNTRTDNLSQTHTGSDTLTPNITEENTPNLTNGSVNTVNGFNSTEGVQSGAQTVTSTGTNTNTRTGTETTQYNNTVANTGTQTDALSGEDTKTRNYTKTKTGNDGKDLSERIAKQREIYLFNFFRDVVFPDINETLTLAIY